MRHGKPKPAVGAQLAVSRKLSEIFLHNPLPSDEAAEKGLLSCYIHNPLLLDQPTDPAWFYHPACRALYEEMKAMRAANVPVGDYILLSKWLVSRGKIEEVGGHGTLAEILDFVPSAQHAKLYQESLIGCHLSRATVSGGVAVVEAGYHHDTKEIAGVASAQMALIEKAARGVHKEPTMEDQLQSWEADWNLMASGKKQSAMPTRWKAWNKKLIGLSPGYTIIMGPRGSGKSILAQNIVTDACLSFNRPGLIVSYEMPVRMIINRIIADIGNINGAYLFHPDTCKPTPEIIKEIGRCIDRIRGARLQIIHDVTMGVEGILSRVRQIHAKHGDCVVVVDYLGLLKAPRGEKFELDHQVIAANSAYLRDLSKELDIPIIALSQINALNTSKGSNAPETDADEIHRVDRPLLPDGKVKEGGIICVKNRNGDSGHVDLVLQGECYRFTDSPKFIP